LLKVAAFKLRNRTERAVKQGYSCITKYYLSHLDTTL